MNNYKKRKKDKIIITTLFILKYKIKAVKFDLVLELEYCRPSI